MDPQIKQVIIDQLMQDDLITMLDGLEDPFITDLCQMIVERMNLVEAKINEVKLANKKV